MKIPFITSRNTYNFIGILESRGGENSIFKYNISAIYLLLFNFVIIFLLKNLEIGYKFVIVLLVFILISYCFNITFFVLFNYFYKTIIVQLFIYQLI